MSCSTFSYKDTCQTYMHTHCRSVTGLTPDLESRSDAFTNCLAPHIELTNQEVKKTRLAGMQESWETWWPHTWRRYTSEETKTEVATATQPKGCWSNSAGHCARKKSRQTEEKVRDWHLRLDKSEADRHNDAGREQKTVADMLHGCQVHAWKSDVHFMAAHCVAW